MASLSLAVLNSPIMANQSFSPDIRRYAIAGAQARLTEMAQEAEAIRRAFPELRETRGPRRREAVAEQEPGDESGTPDRGRRRRSTMTAAQRKAIGERMKKYWAARRAGTATAAATAAEANGAPKAKVAVAKRQSRAAKRGPRKRSAAARKRMSQAQKKRWAAKRKAA